MKIIRTIETHCGGPPCRVALGGFGEMDVPGKTMLEKKAYLEQNRDSLRRLLLREPRANAASCLNLILPSPDPRADFGVVIMEQAPYYPPMSGGNMMSVVTALLETGTLPMQEPETTLAIDTPAGLVGAVASCRGGRVTSVSIANVASFATDLDVTINVPGVGRLTIDVAYGGMFYVLVEAAAAGLVIEPERAAELVAVGEAVKKVAREQIPVVHPLHPEINYLESVLWWGPQKDPDNDGRNTVVISMGSADESGSTAGLGGVLDRSPCGTGTSARLAVLHAKGQIEVGDDYRHEGIIDSIFTGRVLEPVAVGELQGVMPQIAGQAWVTGITENILHEDDPFPEGFILSDR